MVRLGVLCLQNRAFFVSYASGQVRFGASVSSMVREGLNANKSPFYNLPLGLAVLFIMCCSFLLTSKHYDILHLQATATHLKDRITASCILSLNY
jgi:hypothetical protein